MNIETRSAGLTMQDNVVRGKIPYNSLSENLGGFVEKILPGAFAKSIQSNTRGFYLLYQHDQKFPLASTKNNTLSLRDTKDALFFEARLDENDDILRKVKSGLLDSISFGFKMIRDHYQDQNGGVPVRSLIEAELREISIVTFPAYPQASVRELPTFNLLEAKARQRQLELMQLEVEATTPHNLRERTRK